MAVWFVCDKCVGTCTQRKCHDSFPFLSHSHYVLFHVVAVTPTLLISEFYWIYYKFDVHHDVYDVISKRTSKHTRSVLCHTLTRSLGQALFWSLGTSYMDLHGIMASASCAFVLEVRGDSDLESSDNDKGHLDNLLSESDEEYLLENDDKVKRVRRKQAWTVVVRRGTFSASLLESCSDKGVR